MKMLAVYLKSCYMSSKAQGIVEYALLVAAIVVIAAAVLATADGDGTLLTELQMIFLKLASKIHMQIL